MPGKKRFNDQLFAFAQAAAVDGSNLLLFVSSSAKILPRQIAVHQLPVGGDFTGNHPGDDIGERTQPMQAAKPRSTAQR